MINKIVDCLIEEKIINYDDKQVYIFGIYQSIFIIVNISISFLMGLCINKKIEIVYFLIQFFSIRSFSGGYHSDSPIKCTILSTIIQFISVLYIDYISIKIIFLIYINVLISSLIYCLSPIESKNKPLDKLEKNIYKRNTLIMLIVFNVLNTIVYILGKYNFNKLTFICELFILFFQILGKIKKT